MSRVTKRAWRHVRSFAPNRATVRERAIGIPRFLTGAGLAPAGRQAGQIGVLEKERVSESKGVSVHYSFRGLFDNADFVVGQAGGTGSGDRRALVRRPLDGGPVQGDASPEETEPCCGESKTRRLISRRHVPKFNSNPRRKPVAFR